MPGDRLKTAIADAYQRFSAYSLDEPLVYCSCPACMQPDTAIALQTTPLRQIHAGLLSEYTNSAHAYDTELVEPQLKYFLPRYFDLIAAGDPPCYLGLETCLTRLDGYRDTWPQIEIKTIDEFFNAYLAASIANIRLIKWHHGLRLEFEIGDLLSMIILAGGSIDEALQTFECSPDPAAALHMASLRAEISWANGVPYYSNAHLQEKKQAAIRIGTWIRQDQITRRIVDAVDLIDDNDYDDVIEMGLT